MDFPSNPNARLLNGKFTDGDPLTNTPPSWIPAAWTNGLTDEVLEVIEGLGGLARRETDHTQLRQAIEKAITARTPPATTENRGLVELATDSEVMAAIDTVRAVTPASLRIAHALPVMTLDYPTILTPDNRLPVTAVADAAGGRVSIPAGYVLSLAETVGEDAAVLRSWRTEAWTSPDLPINATVYVRGQIIDHQLVLYTQGGTDGDNIPSGKCGEPNATAGGGFDSTPIDVLIAKVVTGAAGSVPTVTPLANAARLEGTIHSQAIKPAPSFTVTFPLAWGRKPKTALSALTAPGGGRDSDIIVIPTEKSRTQIVVYAWEWAIDYIEVGGHGRPGFQMEIWA